MAEESLYLYQVINFLKDFPVCSCYRRGSLGGTARMLTMVHKARKNLEILKAPRKEKHAFPATRRLKARCWE